ncbi:Aste57867_12336 [Aphanomyces stellatus]|uniref:Aste57867_12336 protein n=1 Tax=Aphanomyces stellatus TaxID=120398 RepID=A0A485KWP4_9STRA|nr:hypothetical protein As57867_012290 [Aphanomyces stellatus]VFT89188.1 Aste57867_12336 [Aphanomyces stellatus]
MSWIARILHPFQKTSKKARAINNQQPKRFFTSKTTTSQEETTPPCSPDSQRFVKALPVITLFNHAKAAVPVQIPREHLYQKKNIVGGKSVPFTRRQTKLAKRKVIVYETILEHEVYHSR